MPVVPVWNDDYMGVWHFSKFRNGVTIDSKNGLAAELRGKDVRKFIHASAYIGKGYYAASRTTKTGTYLNVPDDERWTAFAKTGRLAVSFMVNSNMEPDSETEKHHARIVCNKADFGDALGFEVAVAGGETVKPRANGKYDSWGKYGKENRRYVFNIDGEKMGDFVSGKTARTYKPHELLDEGNFAQSLFGTCPFQFWVSDANLEQAKRDFKVKVAEPQRHSSLSELAKAVDPAIKVASLAVLAKMIS